MNQTRTLLSKIESTKKPVIAAVDGLATGGAFEIILACDLIIASDAAQFSLNEINIGIIPGYGGIKRLLQSFGKKKTFEIVTTGRTINAQEAMISGLVTEIYADSEFNKRVFEYCKKLASKPSQALCLIKDTINNLTANPSADDIEIKNFIKAAGSPDAREGVVAFLEKRAPKFI